MEWNRASTFGEEAKKSPLLAKARSLRGIKVSNEGGSMSSQVEKLLSSGFEDSMDSASSQGEILTRK